MSNYTILGFDPASLRNIGWSIIELTKKPSKTAKIHNWYGGTFSIPQTDERWQVLWPMFLVLDAFLNEKEPDLVILEKTNQFVQKAGGFVTGQVSHCMGVIYAVCGKHKVSVDFGFPTSVKKTVAGHGRATKSMVKNATKIILEKNGAQDVKFDSEHTVDATATILYLLIREGIITSLKENEFPPFPKNHKRGKKE